MRSKAAIRRQIRSEWSAIVDKAGTVACQLPAACVLLGDGEKTAKGTEFSVKTGIVYMAPAGEAWGDAQASGKTLCPFASATCRATCLGIAAGRMIQSGVQNARIWKATLYMGARHLWRELLIAECAAFAVNARKLGYSPAIRPDGTSDVGEGPALAAAIDAQVYDYTKSPLRAEKWAAGKYPANYHVTFSYSGENWAECERLLALGVNVAIVFADELPESFRGFTVFSADSTDLRFRDPDMRGKRGQIAGLRFKTARNRVAALKRAGRFVIDNPHLRA